MNMNAHRPIRRRKRRCIVIDESIPFAAERVRFLDYMRASGWSKQTLRLYELRLADFAAQVDIMTPGGITMAQIEIVADNWIRTRRDRRLDPSHKCFRRWFIRVAKRWLLFLGRLRDSTSPPYSTILVAFRAFLDQERGLSPVSIDTKSAHTDQFLNWLYQQRRDLEQVSIHDVDLYLASRSSRWSRVTTSLAVSCLRSFFRFASGAKLCARDIANSIDAPRLYSNSNLPKGPSWAQVRSLIAGISKKTPTDIRDRAVIMLFAVYGFRLGEVAGLTLDSFDWLKEQVVVKRGKQGCEQLYPLAREVGDAILLYLMDARRKTTRRELFLSRTAPFGPLTTQGVAGIVQRRLRAFDTRLMHFGPHSLRHACATHLLAEGLSLKEIGDHLGHRDPRSTQVYAKVDLNGLREVARLELKGLI